MADVTIDSAGNVSAGSGTPLTLYNLILVYETAANPLPDPDEKPSDFDGTVDEWAATVLPIIVKQKRAWARVANEHGNLFQQGGGSAGQALITAATTTLDTASATNFAVAVKNTERWTFVFEAVITCSGVGGVKFEIDAPGGSTIEGYVLGNTTGVTALSMAELTAINTLSSVAFATVVATPVMVRIVATVVAGADGNVTVKFASGTNGQTSTIKAGASFQATKLSGV